MVVFSALRSTLTGLRTVRAPLTNSAWTLASKQTVSKAAVRYMGHGRTLPMIPTKFEYNLYKDHLHFYVLLGLIPIGLVITYTNLFVGQSELTEIPEEHRPEHWEYFRHPITRFYAKYFNDSPEMEYEKALHYMNLEHQKALMRGVEKKVKRLMGEKGDYKGWYYIPTNDRQVYVGHEYNKKEKDDSHLSPPSS